MQQNLEETNGGSYLNPPCSDQEKIQVASLPSLITFPNLITKEEFVDSDNYERSRYAEDDKFSFASGTFHTIEVKTEEELEMYNESEEETEGEYVIVEDAEKYQIIPVLEQDYKVFNNLYFKIDN